MTNKIKLIRPETLEFIQHYQLLKGKAFQNNTELAEVLGFNSAASITEIIKQRQNIDPAKFLKFKEIYGAPVTAGFKGIPMYNKPTDTQALGYLNFPGIEDCDYALQIHDNAMQPYLPNGAWAAIKFIEDQKIVPGEVYYIEWGDYRLFRRLLEENGKIIAHADNTTETIGNAQRYPAFTMNPADIRRLALVKHIHFKRSLN